MLYFILRPTAGLSNATVLTGRGWARASAGNSNPSVPHARRRTSLPFMRVTSQERVQMVLRYGFPSARKAPGFVVGVTVRHAAGERALGPALARLGRTPVARSGLIDR